jgi:hypothetical protein
MEKLQHEHKISDLGIGHVGQQPFAECGRLAFGPGKKN